MYSAAHRPPPALRDGLCQVRPPPRASPQAPPQWWRKASGFRDGRAWEGSSAHCTAGKTDVLRGGMSPRRFPADTSSLAVWVRELHKGQICSGQRHWVFRMAEYLGWCPNSCPPPLSPAGCWSWTRGRWQRAAAQPSCWPRRAYSTGWRRSQAWSEPGPSTLPTPCQPRETAMPGDARDQGSSVAPRC